ncbi:hypothetical protein PG993_004045 [Apiospora rasikravindrae]|uniref:Uncharacterized protein n=1 Tax=Apiospora rasikravindrae TaxID=990691 RepID=A0ABR1TBP6_9PEZI
MASTDLDSDEFEVELEEMGEEGNSFRTQNDPSSPLQRSNIVERKGAIRVSCTARDVVHGYLNNGTGYATLIVHDFQFNRQPTARRIVRVDIEFTYYSANGVPPEVISVAPYGQLELVQTSQTESKARSTTISTGANGLGAQAGVDHKWETFISRETTDATTIHGGMCLTNRNYGKYNTAYWTLLENESAATGVPAHLRVAILLKRHDETEFQCQFKIIVRAKLISELKNLFGSRPKDDPILYDPTLPATNVLRQYDLQNLGAVRLHELTVVEFTNDQEEAARMLQRQNAM